MVPATVAGANDYMGSYISPQQQFPYLQASAYTIASNDYDTSSSQSSWRNFTGSMASDMDPSVNYMPSASVMMQPGDGTESKGGQDMHSDVDLQQNITNAPVTPRWPLTVYHPGSDAG